MDHKPSRNHGLQDPYVYVAFGAPFELHLLPPRAAHRRQWGSKHPSFSAWSPRLSVFPVAQTSLSCKSIYPQIRLSQASAAPAKEAPRQATYALLPEFERRARQQAAQAAEARRAWLGSDTPGEPGLQGGARLPKNNQS